jgi:cobalamin synthase
VEYKREKELGKFLYLAMSVLFLSLVSFSVGMYTAFGLKEFFVILPPSSVFSLAIIVYTYVLSGFLHN